MKQGIGPVAAPMGTAAVMAEPVAGVLQKLVAIGSPKNLTASSLGLQIEEIGTAANRIACAHVGRFI